VGFWSDFYTQVQVRNQLCFAGLFAADGIRHSARVELPNRPGFTRRLRLGRDDDTDFSERDRVLLSLLRHHAYDI